MDKHMSLNVKNNHNRYEENMELLKVLEQELSKPENKDIRLGQFLTNLNENVFYTESSDYIELIKQRNSK